MKILRYLTFPIAFVYYLVTWCRNLCYDFNVFKSKSYKTPVICVGNLSVGGTGKSPMIEYLIRLLHSQYKVATLSRGYKRNTKGFVLANSKTHVSTIGDEPFQFYNKFRDLIYVAVDADRQSGIEKLEQLNPKPSIILLDDAYQHRKVKAGFNILLTTYQNPYPHDFILPLGDLREARVGAKRAQIIVVTKCPEHLSNVEKAKFIKRIQPKAYQAVFFSKIVYANYIYGYQTKQKLTDLKLFTLVTGIAKTAPLTTYLNTQGLKFEHLNYPDHYNFNTKDIAILKQKEKIVTTEKDYMRLKQYKELKRKLFYLPIEVVLDDKNAFNLKIQAFLEG